MNDSAMTVAYHPTPWNKGKLIGQKLPLKLREIWTLRTRLEMGGKTKELALFNLADRPGGDGNWRWRGMILRWRGLMWDRGSVPCREHNNDRRPIMDATDRCAKIDVRASAFKE